MARTKRISRKSTGGPPPRGRLVTVTETEDTTRCDPTLATAATERSTPRASLGTRTGAGDEQPADDGSRGDDTAKRSEPALATAPATRPMPNASSGTRDRPTEGVATDEHDSDGASAGAKAGGSRRDGGSGGNDRSGYNYGHTHAGYKRSTTGPNGT